MKKFLSFFILTGLIFSTGLFAAEASSSDAGSSSGSASSSGGPEVSDGSVTLVVNGTNITLSREQLDLLDSRTIEAALTTDMAESTTREIKLLEEFDVATVQTLADILGEIAKTGSLDKSVARYVTRKNVLQVLSMLDYLQAELIESIVFERLVELGADLSDGSAYYFCGNIAQTRPSVIDKVFTPQAVVPNLRMEKTLTGHTGSIYSVAWSPDGKSLASAGYETTVHVWNVANGESRTLPGHTNSVYSVAWSPDGKSLASASADHTVRVWNIANEESRTLAGHSWVQSVAWSPDGKSLASASGDTTVRVWNVANGESRTLTGHTDLVILACWSPDGKSLASASDDTTVRVWNVANGESRRLTGHTNCVQSVCWSPDGKSLASASNDQTVRVWNVANGESRRLTGHTGSVYSVAWSPDGKSLASASRDHTVRLWNVANGESRTLTGHTNWVYSVAWSPDGKSLASASLDQTVRVWGNSELDACLPLQKLFILINLPKQPGFVEKTRALFCRLIGRVDAITTQHDFFGEWLEVYQSLPEQAKKLLDKDIRAKYEEFLSRNWLVEATSGERKVAKKLVPVQSGLAGVLARRQEHKKSVGSELVFCAHKQLGGK